MFLLKITFQNICRLYFLSSLPNVKLLNLFLHHFSSTCNWLHVRSTRYPRHSGAAKTFDRFPTCQVHQRDQMLEDRNHSLRNNATKIQVYIIGIENPNSRAFFVMVFPCKLLKFSSVSATYVFSLLQYFLIYIKLGRWGCINRHLILKYSVWLGKLKELSINWRFSNWFTCT